MIKTDTFMLTVDGRNPHQRATQVKEGLEKISRQEHLGWALHSITPIEQGFIVTMWQEGAQHG